MFVNIYPQIMYIIYLCDINNKYQSPASTDYQNSWFLHLEQAKRGSSSSSDWKTVAHA